MKFLKLFSPRISYRLLTTPASLSAIAPAESIIKPNASHLKKKVKFNWDNIKNLRGYEKIDLFRDYCRTVDTENAFKLYMIMKENDLLVRLTYIDHHKMFHLLLKDKQKYRQDIIDLWHWLKANQYYPSVGLYKDMFTCYKTWKDLHGAKELYQEMVNSKLQIVPEIHAIMLLLYASSKSTINHLEGIKLWNQIKDTKLNPRLVVIVLELFGKLKMNYAATDLYEQTCSNLPKDGFHALKLQAVYLGALIHAQDYNNAIAYYERNFKNASWIIRNRNMPQIYKTVYQMMMKLCYKTFNLELAEQILEDMERDGLFVNHSMRCRFLVIAGVKRDIKDAEAFYNTHTMDLSSKKTLATYKLALLEVYTTKIERAKAEKLASWFTKPPYDLLARIFLEKMYRNLGDTTAADRMAKIIQDRKAQGEDVNQEDSENESLE